MAIIKSSILTNKGKDAVTKLIANEIQLTFKRIELSEQDTSSMQVVQIEALEALTGVKQHGTINTVSKNNPSEVTVYTLADNQNGALPDYNSPVTASYTLRTVGLFANDGTEDFLYEVLTFSEPDTVPTSEISYNQQFNFTTVVGNSENIQIIVSPAGVVTTDMLKGISVTGKNGLIGGGTIEQSREIEPDYGVEQKKILEGHRLKQVLGVDNFGELNNSDVKIVGNAYWDNQTAEMYICTVSTDKNYADADFFEPFSNSALLGKLQNLIDIKFKDGWIIKKYDNGFKEFIYKTISTIPDKTKIIFPEKFTKIETIMWQATEGTSTDATTSSVSSVGIGNITLESAVFRFYRPDSAPTGNEYACFLLCGF